MSADTPSPGIPPIEILPLDVPVVAFIAARSGTGKTTLIESILKELVKRGYRVGTVKHSAHPTVVDKEGSDSWRFSRAGAVSSVVVGGKMSPSMSPDPDHTAAWQAIRDASRNVHIVLVEGFKRIDLPKIELYREDHSTESIASSRAVVHSGIIAIAAEGAIEVDLPVLPLNRPDLVCDFIEGRFLKGREG